MRMVTCGRQAPPTTTVSCEVIMSSRGLDPPANCSPDSRKAGPGIFFNLYRLQRGTAGLGVGVPVGAGGHGDGGREPFDVPFEGAGEGLVEVVEVEEQGAFRGGVQTEVEQMRVAAQLHGEPGVGLGGEVGGHHGGGTAQEGERRGGHPPVPDRQQLGQAVAALPFQYGDGVGPVDGRDPRVVGGTGDTAAGGLASVGPSDGRGQGVHRRMPRLRITPPAGSAAS